MASCPCQGEQGSRGHQGMSEFLAPVTWYFLSRGVREIVCLPMLVGIVAEVMVRLPLLRWVMKMLKSQ